MATQMEQLLNDPIVLGAGAIVIVAFFLYKKRQEKESRVDINPESMVDRLKAIFVTPTRKRGSPVKDYVKMRGTSNTPRTIGLAIRAKDHSVTSLQLTTDGEDTKYTENKVDGTTYGIIPGSKRIKVLPKYFALKILPTSLLYPRVVDTFDAPSGNIMPGDDYIWFKPGTLFVKYNGVHRVVTPEGMSRIWEMSFSKLHENYLETKQNIPEQYATLNNRISGQLKMENIKSENIREYMEASERNEKKNAMKD